jgi:hypothetical protein
MNVTEPRPPSRGLGPLWAALALGAALLFWIANGASMFEGDRSDAWHHYQYLVDGFLAGHASLSVQPAPELLKLKDPYDPEQNGPWRLWDASLYKGKYYLYFGPTPVLLMLPWQVIFGQPLPQRLAVAAFAIAAMAALALLVAGIRRRHFDTLSPVTAGGILIVALCASWLPVTIRRPDVWELPVAAACACLWWALYFLWRCLESRNGRAWALAAGAAVALMLGSRPTAVFAGAAILALLFNVRRPGDPRFPLAAAIAAAGGLALLAYNLERFGRPFEFGQSYQLWGSDERNVVHFSLLYFPYNAWVYLFSLPDLSPYFPFVLAVPSGGWPKGYLGIDEMHGALVAIPVQLASFAAIAWAWKNRGDPEAVALRRTIWAAALASVFATCILFCYAGAVSRYITEVFAGCTVVATIGLMAIFTGSVGGAAREIIRLLAACASVWTVGYVALASAEHRILFKKTDPGAYAFAAHLLDYPSLWAARGQGIAYGPVALTIRIPPGGADPATVLVSSGRPGMMNQLIIERPDPNHARLVLAENYLTTVAATPLMSVGEGLFRVRLEAPWLYPPPQHPWWDAIADPLLRRRLQTRFAVSMNGLAAEAQTPRFFDPTRLEPWVASPVWAAPGAASVESLEHLPVPSR